MARDGTGPVGEPDGEQERPQDRRSWVVAVGLTVAAVAGLLASAICYWLLVHTHVGRKIDKAATLGSLHGTSLRINLLDNHLRQIDEHSLKVVLVTLLAIGVLRARPVLGAVAALGAAVPVAAAHILRYHILNHRPFSVPSGSFPSEHTVTAAACTLAFLLVCPPRLRGWLALPLAVIVSGVATQVQVLGWHRPSDSIGGCLIAFAVVSAVAAALAWARPGRRRRNRRHWRAVGLLGLACLVTLVLAGLAASDGRGIRGGLASRAVQHDVSLAALWLTVSSVAALFAVFVHVLGDADLDPGLPRALSSLREKWMLRRWAGSDAQSCVGD